MRPRRCKNCEPQAKETRKILACDRSLLPFRRPVVVPINPEWMPRDTSASYSNSQRLDR
jgi:hypothetical protein